MTTPNAASSKKDLILDVIAKEGMIPRENLVDDATIASLGLKSMDLVMIITALEDAFNVYIKMDAEFEEGINLKSLVEILEQQIDAGAAEAK